MTIAYKPEEQRDATDVANLIKSKTNGTRKVLLIPLDLRSEENCKKLVDNHMSEYSQLDCL